MKTKPRLQTTSPGTGAQQMMLIQFKHFPLQTFVQKNILAFLLLPTLNQKLLLIIGMENWLVVGTFNELELAWSNDFQSFCRVVKVAVKRWFRGLTCFMLWSCWRYQRAWLICNTKLGLFQLSFFLSLWLNNGCRHISVSCSKTQTMTMLGK